MVAEMMSFGQLSKWYSNLGERALRNRIAQPLGLPETVLVPLVRHVTDIRISALIMDDFGIEDPASAQTCSKPQ
jgi:abortive infection bacteriophage resistance protein